MNRIVCDSGPLLHLREAGVRDLLSSAGDVHIPIAVDLEIRSYEADWHIRRPAWLHVTPLDSGPALEARSWQQAGLLHYGEAQAIALARQLRADWLLTDDAAARLLAQSWGLEVHGSLGLVLWAAAMGHLSRREAETALDRLARSSRWVSPSVLLAAKAALNQMAYLLSPSGSSYRLTRRDRNSHFLYPNFLFRAIDNRQSLARPS
jgi:predicted nucleic acid-binding protein